MSRACVLVVDNHVDLLRNALQVVDAQYDVEAVRDVAEALSRVQSAPLPDVVILDAGTIGPEPACVVAQFRQARPLLKIVVQAGEDDLNHVVKSVQMGADACVWKPVQNGALARAVRECLEWADAILPPVNEKPGDVLNFDDGSFFVAASPAMQKLRDPLDQVAKVDVPVLCLGESGTGKEVAARWLHKLSNRSQNMFLKVNCAAVPAELLESELFGHERGAFTGAYRAKPGKFEQCNHGILFLDEIAEMPVALQAKLLHVIQDQEFVRLGGCSRVKVAVRVIAATNVNIQEAIAQKTFREDLYYRLSALVFELPPLRRRKEDIPILLRRYLAFHAHRLELPERALSNQLWQQCLRYDWPGNVRELENFAKRYLIFGEAAAEFSNAAGAPSTTRATAPADLKEHVRGMRNGAEASAIACALEQTKWNRKEAAGVLGISYKSILSKIQQYGLDRQNNKHASTTGNHK